MSRDSGLLNGYRSKTATAVAVQGEQGIPFGPGMGDTEIVRAPSSLCRSPVLWGEDDSPWSFATKVYRCALA
jgi:hypothetical protein